LAGLCVNCGTTWETIQGKPWDARVLLLLFKGSLEAQRMREMNRFCGKFESAADVRERLRVREVHIVEYVISLIAVPGVINVDFGLLQNTSSEITSPCHEAIIHSLETNTSSQRSALLSTLGGCSLEVWH
jgi:hypothetical protein